MEVGDVGVNGKLVLLIVKAESNPRPVYVTILLPLMAEKTAPSMVRPILNTENAMNIHVQVS